MEIKVILEAAPELLTAIDTFTAALVNLVGVKEKAKPAKPAPAPTGQALVPAEPKPATDQPVYTLEIVRAKLAALSQSGKQKEVKAIIESFGVAKLTDIPAENYPEVMQKAAELEAES